MDSEDLAIPEVKTRSATTQNEFLLFLKYNTKQLTMRVKTQAKNHFIEEKPTNE